MRTSLYVVEHSDEIDQLAEKIVDLLIDSGLPYKQLESAMAYATELIDRLTKPVKA